MFAKTFHVWSEDNCGSCYNQPMPTPKPDWREMIIALPADCEEEAAAFLVDQGTGGIWIESIGPQCRLHLYLPVEEKRKAAAIRRGLRQRMPNVTLSIDEALRPEEEWQTAWQKHSIPIQRIGKRLLIGAPWHFPLRNRSGREVIQLAPGMAFGTGTHATTKSCLVFLEGLIGRSARGALLDVGTGSGILAIAGAKLGADRVTAVENDPIALAVARENARINGVASKIIFRKTLPSRADYQWVVANMTSPALVDLAEALTRSVKPGGKLILSGILITEWTDVFARYRTHCLLLRKVRKGEWITLLLEKKRGTEGEIGSVVRRPG